MADSGHTTILTDGTFDFSGGVNSDKVTTIQSELTPNGLKRNELSWLNNGTVRGGGIIQRTGFQPNGKLHDGSALFQGGYLYEPIDGSNPYLIVSIGGHIIQYIPDLATVTDLSVLSGLSNPSTVDQAFFCQAEEFLVIQAGDGITLPLFWDGSILRRSNGLPGGELPAASAMDYYMGRLWYAQGRTYSAGDIVKGPSGTAPYDRRDSVLKVTENPLAIGGDGFTVPSNAGNIRAIKHSANLDTALGQGRLFIFTRKSIYACNVPVTRADWIATTNNNQPLQTVVQIVNGAVSDRSIVPVNGDLFYQSLEPSIRSFITALRYFEQWGNTPISQNVNRALQFNDRELMRFSTGIQFDNRLIQAVLPTATSAGVVHQAMVILDFDVISSLSERLPPVWEGMYEGLKVFQLFSGDFGGRERAFGVMLSDVDGSINVWELTDYSRTENGDNRITWIIEFPAFTWGNEFKMKLLDGGECWIDKLSGTVEFDAYYRQDADPCWKFWFHTQFCSAKNCAEDTTNPVCYPIGPNYREGYKFPIVFPSPKDVCDSMNVRPSNIGYQFQVKLVIKGWCRIRGLLLFAQPRDRAQFEGLRICQSYANVSV